MKCQILHECGGRMRVRYFRAALTALEAERLEAALLLNAGLEAVRVNEACSTLLLRYRCTRAEAIDILARFSWSGLNESNPALPDKPSPGRRMRSEYPRRLMLSAALFYGGRLLLPAPVRMLAALLRSLRYLKKGLASLRRRRMNVELLDAAAIAASLLRGHFGSASTIMFLLGVGETMEEWTHRKSVDDLARTIALQVRKAWQRTPAGDVLRPIEALKEGDLLVLRKGEIIPLDARVLGGEALVNQASMTGEAEAVRKCEGGYVYAGTVLEEGELLAEVSKVAGSGKYDRIVRMIEDSQKLKSGTEARALRLADRLIPYTFAGAALVYLLTRDVGKALSVLLVDFSCALKLAMPLTVLAAMHEGRRRHISIKGGKYLEAVAEADTVVLDKTGTLTCAAPSFREIICFSGRRPDDMLRLAACLEEHFPHSVARAVVAEAKRRALRHEERHRELQYIVAHGISSRVDEQRVLLGSYHFVFQDEGCTVAADERERFAALPLDCSLLYMAIDGELAAVICIEDPLRAEAPAVLARLRALGISQIVMMTGDSRPAAAALAARLGIDHYYAEVLPEDKARFVAAERAAGRKVIMVGDGINDSPALSEADVGVSLSEGAAIAREVADINLSGGSLCALVELRELSDALMRRVRRNYRFIVGFNLGLIALGLSGLITPALSALLHNAATVGISLDSKRPLLPARPPEAGRAPLREEEA